MLSVQGMQDNVLSKIKEHKSNNIKIFISSNSENIRLHTSIYELEIVINPKWVGYDFSVNSNLTRSIPVGDSLDTDLYPLNYDKEVTGQIYKDLLVFLDDLLADKIYYGLKEGKAVFAKPDHSTGGYRVAIYPKGLFGKGIFTTIKREHWGEEEVRSNNNLKQIIANEA